MGGLLLKMGFFDKIGTFFDIIPKLVYFMAAIFLSAIDVLQCLVRKLAGLDVYYVSGVDASGAITDLAPVAQQDPLSEFVMGILGLGDSAPLYKGLNTVFWSLAIFAVICLAVTSIIAIIKSHYNEDVAGTNPWKYIYTAIKAVFTFAIVPFAVIIGMELASWTLQTLDGITAGSATEEALVSMYGSEAAGQFLGEELEGSTTGTKYYSHYDFFGMGSPTSSTPFSGMMFKACMYEANRSRNFTEFANGVVNLTNKNGVKFFGQVSQYSGDAGIADQIDYAFMNNLRMKEDAGFSKGDATGVLVDAGVKYWSATDLINPLFSNIKGFSKYNVGWVWMFYNLWSFNFIVAFGGGATILGIMLSVIIGLMSRLMKGAILFLIYPSLLGITPLDNFKAFKSWQTQFMQQVMMAFGAIIGMNLTLLILPYVQNIKFFNIGIVDSIVNIVIVMTGLMMMKDIIAMISQFAGGADANAAGSALKGEVGKAIGGGAKIAGAAALKTGKAVVGGTIGLGKAAVGAGKGIGKMVAVGRKDKNGQTGAQRALIGAQGELANAKNARNAAFSSLDNELDKEESNNAGMNRHMAKLYGSDEFKNASAENQAKMKRDAQLAYVNANSDGVANMAAIKNAQQGVQAAERQVNLREEQVGVIGEKYNFRKNADGSYNPNDIPGVKERLKKATLGGMKEGYTAEDVEYVDKNGKIKTKKVYKDKDGNEVSAGQAYTGIAGTGMGMLDGMKVVGNAATSWFDEQTMGNAGKHLADGFLKSLGGLTAAAGLDKMLKGMGDIFANGTTFKGGVFDGPPKKEGDKLAADIHEKQTAQADKHHQELLKAIENQGKQKPATDLSELRGTFTAMAKALEEIKKNTNKT